MQVQEQLIESDYVAAQFLHVRPRRSIAIVGILLLCLALWTLWMSHSLAILVWLVLLLLYFFVFIPYKSKHTFRQYKALSEPLHMEVRDSGIFFKRQNSEGLVPWSHIVKWRSNDTITLIYPANNVFHLVPSRFFSSPELYKAFHKMLREKVGNAT